MGLRDGIPSFEILASTISGTNIQTSTFSGTSFNSISGVNLWLTGSATAAGSGTDTGRIFPMGAGSPISYNQFFQIGSVVTSAGSNATLIFGIPFANTAYTLLIGQAGSLSVFNVGTAGSNIGFISGTIRASGVTIVGGPSQTYQWFAAGFI